MKRSIWLCAASLLAAPVLLTGCADPVEPAAPRAEPVADQGAGAGQGMTASGIEGVLRCEGLNDFPGFERELVFQSAGAGVFELRSGAPDEARYEFWRLEIESGRFTATGEYIEGGPELKAGNLTGDVYGNRLSGEGMRGPRTCQLEAVFAD